MFDKVHFTWLQALFLERQNERHVLGVMRGHMCPMGRHPFPRWAQNEFSVTQTPRNIPGRTVVLLLLSQSRSHLVTETEAFTSKC